LEDSQEESLKDEETINLLIADGVLMGAEAVLLFK
jgi:hypothetical protein